MDKEKIQEINVRIKACLDVEAKLDYIDSLVSKKEIGKLEAEIFKQKLLNNKDEMSSRNEINEYLESAVSLKNSIKTKINFESKLKTVVPLIGFVFVLFAALFFIKGPAYTGFAVINVQMNVSINSTYGTNYTNENLTVYWQASNPDNDNLTNITDWRLNGNSIAVLNVPFEGGSNSTRTKDYSSYGNNVTVYGAGWNATGGHNGKGAYQFNKTTNQRIEVNLFSKPNTSNLTDITVSFWLKPEEGADGYVFGYGAGAYQLTYWLLSATQNIIIFRDPTVKDFYCNSQPAVGTWRHIVVVQSSDSSTGGVSCYTNGVLSGNNVGATTLPFITGQFYIGSGAGNAGSGSFNGSIDEFMVFNRSLTYEEIQLLYKNQSNIIHSLETKGGENWTAVVTPNDGLADGSSVSSNTINIIGPQNCTIPTSGLNITDLDDITLCNGTHNLNPGINIKRMGVTVTGNDTILNSTNSATVNCIQVYSPNVTVQNIKNITNCNIGVYYSPGATGYGNNLGRIFNNTIYGSTYGIYLSYFNGVTIDSNDISNKAGGNGISVVTTGTYNKAINNKIYGLGNGNGIYSNGGSVGWFDKINNTIYNIPTGNGINDASVSLGNSIANNTIYSCSSGITSSGTTQHTVENNNIFDCISRGIYFNTGSQSITVRNNILNNVTTGVYFAASSANNTLDNNSFSNNTADINYLDTTALNGLIIRNESSMINYTNQLVKATNLRNSYILTTNVAAINSSLESGLNKTALISLPTTTCSVVPYEFANFTSSSSDIYVSGSVCQDCIMYSCFDGLIRFQNKAWSSLTINETSINYSSVWINSTYGFNGSNENLTVYWVQTAPAGMFIANITDWRLNGTSRSMVNLPFEGGNSSTWTKDYSTYGRNGTVNGAIYAPGSGVGGTGAYYFNGGGNYQINGTMNLVEDNNYTISFWMNWSTASGSYFSPFATSGVGTRIERAVSGDTFIMGYQSSACGGYHQITSGQWHYITMIHNTTAYSWYVDGVYQDGCSKVWVAITSPQYYIGYYQLDRRMAGYIDNVEVMNRVISTDEMLFRNASRYNSIPSSSLVIGQNWTACVTPNTGAIDGDTSCSDKMTILPPSGFNFPPSISNLLINSTFATNFTTENLTAYWSASDTNGDNITNITDWRVNGRSIALLNMPFEGGSNSTWTKDYSTYGKNGTVNGATWNATSGYNGFGTYYFDGTGNYIDIGTITTSSNGYTVSLWFNVPDALGDRRILQCTSCSAGQGGSISIGGAAVNSQIYVWNGATWQLISNFPDGNYNNSWQHLAVVYDTYGNVTGYINGVKGATGSSQFGFNLGTTRIGSNYGIYGSYFKGRIDEFEIYNTTLSPEQIKLIYENKSNIISEKETTKGDVWSLAVTPNDKAQDGATVISNNLTTLNIINFTSFYPNATGQLQNITNQINTSIITTISRTNNLTFNITASEADYEPLTFNWFINGIVKFIETLTSGFTSMFSQLFNTAGQYNVSVVANGSNSANNKTFTWYVNVSSNPPITNNVLLNSTFTTNYTTENLTVYWNSTSPNNAPISNITDWRINGRSIALLNLPFEPTGQEPVFIKDYSTNNYNATNITSPPLLVDGKIGKAYRFNGYQEGFTVNNRVYPLTNGATTTFWFKDEGPVISGVKGLTGSGFVSPQIAPTIYIQGTRLKWEFDSLFTQDTGIDITQNEWYHLTISYNSTGFVRVYLNGVEIDNGAGTIPVSYYGEVAIGTIHAASPVYFNGTIDEFQIWNRTLTQEQILLLNQSKQHIISEKETNRGDVWSVAITSNDGMQNGTTIISNNLTITNYLPTITSALLNSTFTTNLTTENLTIYSTTYDLEDPVVNITDWRLNGRSIALLNMPFEGGSNSTWTKDYSTYGNNLTFYGPTWNSTGGYDGKGAYKFNGASNYVSGINIDESRAFSLAAWMNYAASSAAYEDPIGFGTGSTLRLERNANANQFYLAYGGSVCGAIMSVTPDVWNHIVIYSNTTNYGWYLNGVYQSGCADSNSAATNEFRLGYIGWSRFFNGYFDELKIFNRSLSSEQILLLYRNKTNVISEKEITKDEVWSAAITPNDGIQDGATVLSNNITILNAVNFNSFYPNETGQLQNITNQINVSINANTSQTTNLTFNATATEAEYEPLTFSWFINGVLKFVQSLAYGFTSMFSHLFNTAGQYNVSVVLSGYTETGGNITYVDNYVIHTYYSNGTFVPPPGISSVEVLVVAGGGGGGTGGGGAGGLIYNSSYAVTGSIPVVIGYGGLGKANGAYTPGNNGQNSSFGTLLAVGGGGGQQVNVLTRPATGGSGGGSAATSIGAALGGLGIPGQGNDGGNTTYWGSSYPSGGGGGAGARGNDTVSNDRSGDGGKGLYYSQFASWGSPAGWFAGGGGGQNYASGATPGAGGLGGGGAGLYTLGYNGTPNTGGGGGGSAGTFPAGTGGSGIVIVRYLGAPSSITNKTFTFFVNASNQAPAISNLFINSTFATNTTTENLTGYWTSTDNNNDSIVNITDWRINGVSLALLNLPFENHSLSETNATDYSTFNKTATVSGIALVGSGNCKYGCCYNISNSGGITPKNSPAISTANNYSFSAWYNSRNGSSGWNNIFDSRASSYNVPLRAAINEGVVLCLIQTPAANTYVVYMGSEVVGQWEHIVCSYDSTSRNLTGYRNGVNYGTITISGSSSSSTYGIGYDPTYANEVFDGYIDEVLLINASLAQEDVLLLNASRKNIISSNLTRVNQIWSLAITPNDGIQDGITLLSNNLTIRNINITIASIYPNQTGQVQLITTENNISLLRYTSYNNLTFNITIGAIEQETLTFRWSVNDAVVATQTVTSGFTSMFSNLFNSVGLFNVTVVVNGIDSANNDTFAFYLNVSDGHPIVSDVILNSTFGTNYTNENLTVYWNSTDPAGDAIVNITDWRLNGISLALLNMPFENHQLASTNVTDYSTFNKTASVSGATLANSCKVGSCYYFANAGAITPRNSPALSTMRNYSISVWFNATASGGTNIIFDSRSGSYVVPSRVVVNGGSAYCVIQSNAPNTNFQVNLGAVTLNTWNHIVCSYDSSTRNLTGYYNGVLKGTTTIGSANVTSSTYGIGYDPTYSGEVFDGYIDELILFNKTTTQEEVLLLNATKQDCVLERRTTKGQNWTACVTPNDGTWDGATACSNNLTIANTPPTAPTLTTPNKGNDTLINLTTFLGWNASTDVDGDSPTYYINLTSQYCADNYYGPISSTNYTSPELSTVDVCGVYFWKVRSYDGTDYSTYSDEFNFSIQPYVNVILTQNLTDFGNMQMFDTNDTADENPLPFIIQSNSNVKVNVSVRALDDLWEKSGVGNDSFRFKAREDKPNSFNTTKSRMSYSPITGYSVVAISDLKYVSTNNTAKIDLEVTVPDAEPPGYKYSTLMMEGAQS